MATATAAAAVPLDVALEQLDESLGLGAATLEALATHTEKLKDIRARVTAVADGADAGRRSTAAMAAARTWWFLPKAWRPR